MKKLIYGTILLILLISVVSATIILPDDAIFKGYRILGIDGNESILFTPSLIGNGNVFRAIEKFSGNLTRAECQSWNNTDIFNFSCLQWKNITYFQQNFLRHRNNQGLDNFISKVGNAFQYIIPLQPFLKWIKFGEQTITIIGDTSYNSSNINTTSETGFAHLNISNSSIVLYMPFDDNVSLTTTYDYTNNSNDGTLAGNTVYNTSQAIYGGAYTFDGVGDYINITPAPASLNSTNVTWSAWVKVPTESSMNVMEKVNSADATQHFGMWLGEATGSLTNELISILRNSDGARIGYTTATRTELFDGNWHHVTITADGTSYKIYLDGVSKTLSGTGNNGLTTITGYNQFTIGSYRGSSSFVNGSIDEVMIWNTALNSTEVLAIYNNQTARFHGTGEMLFQNLNFGVNDTTNISLKSCQRNMGSSLRARVNTGNYINFDSDCFIQDYNITGNLTNANLTIGFIGGNGTIANTFYTPLVLGNITLESKQGDTTPPNISFANPTTNATNLSQNFIFANLSFADANPISMANISLFNSTQNIINSTQGTISTLEINFTDLADGTYYLNASVNDSLGNRNQTETRKIVLDTTAPTFVINNPDNIDDEISNDVLYSITTNEISTCQVLTDSGSRESLISSNTNLTHTLLKNLVNGVHNVTFYCNDTLSNGETTASVAFNVHFASNYPSTLGGGTLGFRPSPMIGVLDVNLSNMTIDSFQTNFYVDFKNKINIQTFDFQGNLIDVDGVKIILLNNITNNINVFGQRTGEYIAEVEIFELKPEILKFEIVAYRGNKIIARQFEMSVAQKDFKEILIDKIQGSLEYINKNKLLFGIFVLLTIVFFILLFFIYKKSKKDKKEADDLEF